MKVWFSSIFLKCFLKNSLLHDLYSQILFKMHMAKELVVMGPKIGLKNMFEIGKPMVQLIRPVYFCVCSYWGCEGKRFDAWS